MLWLLGVLELLIVFAVTFLIGYVLFCLLWGQNPARLVALIGTINENWKAALILLIPLFYRPVRIFLDNLEEAGSFKRSKVAPQRQREQVNPTAGGE